MRLDIKTTISGSASDSWLAVLLSGCMNEITFRFLPHTTTLFTLLITIIKKYCIEIRHTPRGTSISNLSPLFATVQCVSLGNVSLNLPLGHRVRSHLGCSWALSTLYLGILWGVRHGLRVHCPWVTRIFWGAHGHNLDGLQITYMVFLWCDSVNISIVLRQHLGSLHASFKVFMDIV